ncbi:sodium:solute symporter [Luteimonas sp. RD2P54]|uniref:Sodium:solute symporter n=1 Tax=Luteimonas endophytica TaxID=3042023 RepID=A0ABT6JAG3_9GAMM|nr:sodium:solute symporter [Luteimonas endophytica]MDH5823818.1 sodium:solute symporter [Luteimonas endophytica]
MRAERGAGRDGGAGAAVRRWRCGRCGVGRAWRHLASTALVAVALLFAAPALAESLSTLRTGPLPAWPADAPAPEVLVAVAGVPVVVAGDRAWMLDDAGRGRALPWRRPAGSAVAAGFADAGGAGYLLLAPVGTPRAVTRIVRLDAPAATAAPGLPPELPAPLAQAQGAARAGALYVAGLGADGSPRLLTRDGADRASGWTAREGWPGGGAPRALVATAQGVHLAVDGGGAGRTDRLLRWTAGDGWRELGPVPGTVVAGAARALGQAHLLLAVRDPDGSAFLSYNTITGAWAEPPGARAGTIRAAAPWGDGMAWLDDSAGAPRLATSEVESGRLLLRWLDWIIMAVYLAAMVAIGLFFYARDRNASTADFFVGGRSIPFWVAGVSLYATNVSSISFIAIPAKAFESNWQYLTNNLIAVVGLMFVAVWIVPLLRRLDLMSVFSYLETRFHPAIRMIASALCIVVQIGSRMSVILFLPSLAIATITGIDVVWSVLIMGGFTILYTTLGGMKAVVWTDFVQVFVMFGGALFAIGFILLQIDGGLPEFTAAVEAGDKMKLLDFSFDLTQATVWGFLFLVLFDVVLTFPKDQVLMQRVLSTRSDREAGRSVWTFAAIMIPGGCMFYGIGTALYVYYKAHPERMDPLLPIDATFPLFIAAELPMGVTGLIVAGIFAAAMSTLSSIINSVSTLVSVDFYERLVRNPSQRTSVRLAEATGVLVGLIGIGLALLLSRFDIHSLLDISIELFGLLGGGFAGAYTLGMFTRRANAPGVAIGIASAIVLTLVARYLELVHSYFYLAISILVCIVVGYLASLLFPAPTRSLAGLTVHDPAPGAAS